MPGTPEKIKDDSRSLRFLYKNAFGRVCLKLLVAPWVSKVAGKFLDSGFSRCLIPSFVKKNDIDMSQYEKVEYHDFNEFFTRKILPELRPVDMSDENFVAPCDGLLSSYHIQSDTVIPAKQSEYKIADLIDSDKEAAGFMGGTCLVFRLCVNHYHRYAFFDDCEISAPKFIPGKLHTVRPIALENDRVFTTNSREVTYLDTKNFGRCAQIEVGAMLVGKIANNLLQNPAKRGEEKGKFLYGGSTVILLLPAGVVDLDDSYFELTNKGYEVPVKMGEVLGKKNSNY